MSIVKIVDIPPANPHRWIDFSAMGSGLQTFRNNDWFANQVQSWNEKTNYFQSWYLWDIQTVQISIGGLYRANENAHVIEVIDRNEKVLATISPTDVTYLAGNKSRVGQVDYSLATLRYKFILSQLGINKNDIYFFRLRLQYSIADIFKYDEYVTEPMYFGNYISRSMLMTYSHNVADFGSNYANNWQYNLRVDAELRQNSVRSEAVGYTDQQANPRQQSNTPSKDFKLIFGEVSRGMPMWVYEKINIGLAHNKVEFDDVRYVKPPEEQLETRTLAKRWLKFIGSVRVVEYNAAEANIFASKTPLTLFPVNNYPILVRDLKMKNSGSNNEVNVFTGFEINNVSELNAFKNILNTYFGPAAGLKGLFVVQLGYLCYVNGEDEYWDENLTTLFTKYFTLQHTKSNFYAIPQIRSGLTVLASDVAIVPLGNTEVYCYGAPGGPDTLFTFDFNFVGRGNPATANIRVWHADTVKEIYISNTRSYRTLIPTYMPSTLTTYSVRFTDSVSLDVSSLPATLQQLVVTDNRFLASVLGLNSKSWPNLVMIGLSRNKLGFAECDKAFMYHQVFTTFPDLPSNGVFAVNDQNPAAGVTSLSLSARTNLITKSWAVLI